MKTSTFAIGALANVASAHYFFETNIIDGAFISPAGKARPETGLMPSPAQTESGLARSGPSCAQETPVGIVTS